MSNDIDGNRVKVGFGGSGSKVPIEGPSVFGGLITIYEEVNRLIGEADSTKRAELAASYVRHNLPYYNHFREKAILWGDYWSCGVLGLLCDTEEEAWEIVGRMVGVQELLRDDEQAQMIFFSLLQEEERVSAALSVAILERNRTVHDMVNAIKDLYSFDGDDAVICQGCGESGAVAD